MAKPLVSDELWQRIEPLFFQPKPRRFRFPGAKPLDYRKVLTGIIFVLKTGIPWEQLPPGDGLWLWHDLPELPQCLAAGRGLGEVAPDPLGRARRRPTSWIGPAPRSIVPRPEPWEAAIGPDRWSDGSMQILQPRPMS